MDKKDGKEEDEKEQSRVTGESETRRREKNKNQGNRDLPFFPPANPIDLSCRVAYLAAVTNDI